MSATQTITLDSVVQSAKNHVASELAGEVVILNLSNGTYYGLDGVGVDVWQQIQQPTSVAAIRDAILAEYDVDANECEQDILALLADMATSGLIEIANEQPA